MTKLTDREKQEIQIVAKHLTHEVDELLEGYKDPTRKVDGVYMTPTLLTYATLDTLLAITATILTHISIEAGDSAKKASSRAFEYSQELEELVRLIYLDTTKGGRP